MVSGGTVAVCAAGPGEAFQTWTRRSGVGPGQGCAGGVAVRPSGTRSVELRSRFGWTPTVARPSGPSERRSETDHADTFEIAHNSARSGWSAPWRWRTVADAADRAAREAVEAFRRAGTLAQQKANAVGLAQRSAHFHRRPVPRRPVPSLTGPPSCPPLRPGPRRPVIPVHLVGGGGDGDRRDGDHDRRDPDRGPQRRRWLGLVWIDCTVAPYGYHLPAHIERLRSLYGTRGRGGRGGLVEGAVAGCDGEGGRKEDDGGDREHRDTRRCSQWVLGPASSSSCCFRFAAELWDGKNSEDACGCSACFVGRALTNAGLTCSTVAIGNFAGQVVDWQIFDVGRYLMLRSVLPCILR
jgi:hypothetical protein